MRKQYELLSLLYNTIKKNGVKTGLCFEIALMRKEREISPKEKDILDEIIANNKPSQRQINISRGYYFPHGEKEPRLEYLKGLIAVYKKRKL